MNISEEHIELFENYLTKKLGTLEVKDFEARLAYDNEFSQEFAAYQNIEIGINNHFRNQLKEKLQAADKQLDIEKPARNNSVRFIAWTSSIAASIIFGIFIFQQISSPGHEQLVLQYWPVEQGLPVKMSNKGRYDDAMNAFKMEQYDKAYALLEPIDSDTADYFLGVISYEQGELELAQQFFEVINKSSSYFNEAQFRLALVFLLSEEVAKAKEILQAQIEQQTEFAETSKDILEKI